MKILDNYALASALCLKYGYKLKLKVVGDHQRAFAEFDTDTGEGVVRISLFHTKFKQTMLHEISHLRSFKRMSLRGIHLREHLSNPINYFREETAAWLFAKRLMKEDFDSDHAKMCLQTYSVSHYREKLTKETIHPYTDNFARCMSRV